ncbi:MBL fold metallo-hydrolase [Nereida sp. MMG025]|uniref:MBL fold metallo-hydrolase n=1 Tax=Nereida sp. MMG025 TaxID=2909981 RepID=UPI001F1D8187|nr:MBL fold metallo-hydrolase [Nereida sp. MMG025]MCF6443161.1 MBL fold metallo-hydrolase [Nereida sp. MMG025]
MSLTYQTPYDLTRAGSPAIRRVICENPSPLTGFGTNSYLIGTRDVAVIDPGPDDDRHLAAVLDALTPDQRITHILVTHAHLDHSPLARKLSERTGAPVFAFGGPDAGRSDIMTELMAHADLAGGEGRDEIFRADVTLKDGDTVKATDWALTAHWTPGHFGNHMTFETGDTVFSGDLVMGWATSLVSPPDGDLTDFMASCRALRGRAPARLLPGHGAVVENACERIDWLIDHRLQREAQILEVLSTRSATAADITKVVYRDVATHLWPAATRNVLAHLIDLKQQNRAFTQSPIKPDSVFSASK